MIGNLAKKYDIPIEEPEKLGALEDEPRQLQQPRIEPVAAPWREFPRVVALSDFLKQYPNHGIQIVRMDNAALLHFDPPLDPKEKERMDIAGQALELFARAVGDIEFLMHRGLISIEDHPGYH